MNRFIISLVIGFAAVVAVIAPASPAFAQDAAPTPAQMAAAKKAFSEGKKFHEQGKLPEAIEKFKESHRLSKNPLLLYNIGLTMDEAGMEDLALFYYRKFLAEAPADAAQRETVVERAKVLEKKFNPNAGTTTDPGRKDPVKEPKGPVVVKPAGTYTAADFEHQVVDVAPPGKPLDVTAFVPEDSGFTVTLHYRTAGEGKFTSREMKWRYKELVARVPAPKMIGDSVQYYLEVKDQSGAVVTRAGKSTSPNLITLEAGATARFYPDMSDDGEVKNTIEDVRRRDDEDDPLNKNKKSNRDDDAVELQPQPVGPPGSGFSDVGSSKFKYAKWGTTATAGTLLGLSVFSFVQAGKYATSLEDDSTECGSPPCRPFSSADDSYPKDLQAAGKRYQSIHKVTLGLGVATAAVAGYFWYKELTAKKRGELKVGKSNGRSPETSWVVVPALGDGTSSGFLGGAAATQF
ncbi:MAG: hypothetical protein H0T89_33585 [Deltaproteobacteria bacterium]|nr:hypothetical protein [Deltaproteobacteria bacterium]MDQ3298617.1 hypothetical protein [Myxococcota bacterium]